MPKCQKIAFVTRKEAKRFMKNANHNDGMKLTTAYFCEDCLHWHLTSQPKQNSRDYTRRLNKQK